MATPWRISRRVVWAIALAGVALVLIGLFGLVTEPHGLVFNPGGCLGTSCTPSPVVRPYPFMSVSFALVIAVATVVPLVAFLRPGLWWPALALVVSGPVTYGAYFVTLSGNAPTPYDVDVAVASSILLMVGGAVIALSMVLVGLARRAASKRADTLPAAPS